MTADEALLRALAVHLGGHAYTDPEWSTECRFLERLAKEQQPLIGAHPIEQARRALAALRPLLAEREHAAYERGKSEAIKAELISRMDGERIAYERGQADQAENMLAARKSIETTAHNAAIEAAAEKLQERLDKIEAAPLDATDSYAVQLRDASRILMLKELLATIRALKR